ncbi:MAG: helix-turn-helix domain-containing protein [Sphingobium sp.]|nr:helix-turn-helix domain-containing protein [Sphingobium sp.]
MLQTFTTRASNRLERSRQWQAATLAEPVEFEDDRQASLRGGDFGPLVLCIVSMGRHRVIRGETDRAKAPPALRFIFQEEGSATIHQGGRGNQIHAGQWCALRTDMSFRIEAPEQSRQLVIALPCTLVPPPRKAIDWWRRPRSFLRGPAQILHASATASIMTGTCLTDTDRDQLGAQIAILVDMTLRAEDPGPAPGTRESRRRAILDHIDRNLADPDLGISGIARAFSLSPRTIHKLFEGEAQTVARVIWDRRLERCREEMTDPAMAARSITEIAHLWGFSDSQHFSRAFKQRFGLTPRDYRNLFALH